MRTLSIRDSQAGTHHLTWPGILIRHPALALRALGIDKRRLDLLDRARIGQKVAKVLVALTKENIGLQGVREAQAVIPPVAMMGTVGTMNAEGKNEDVIPLGDVPAERTRCRQAIEALDLLLLQDPVSAQGEMGAVQEEEMAEAVAAAMETVVAAMGLTSDSHTSLPELRMVPWSPLSS
jgi:hypothetical protein